MSNICSAEMKAFHMKFSQKGTCMCAFQIDFLPLHVNVSCSLVTSLFFVGTVTVSRHSGCLTCLVHCPRRSSPSEAATCKQVLCAGFCCMLSNLSSFFPHINRLCNITGLDHVSLCPATPSCYSAFSKFLQSRPPPHSPVLHTISGT